MMGTSIGATHGTATKKNAIGKAKCRSHGFPPTDHIYKRVSVATEAVWSQPSGRQSGFPISKSRIGKSIRSAGMPTKIQRRTWRDGLCAVPKLGRDGARPSIGRSPQRNQKRKSEKKGTNQQYVTR